MAKYNYSVIIPHRNTPNLLDRCLKSIPQREDIQVLVIDDNSDEQYIASVREACTSRSNVRLTETHEGLGAGYARNLGLKQVDSKWLLFADADDYYLPDAWKAFDAHCNDQTELICFYSICRYSDTGLPGNRHLQLVNLLDDFLANPNHITEGALRYNYNEPVGKMIRTNVIFDNNLQFEQTRWANDVHMSTMIGVYARSISVYKQNVYCITISHGSLVHQHSLEARRCRYEVLLRNNAFLRQIGLPEFQYSLMYSLRWAAKLSGLKAVWEFLKIGRKYGADFTIGANKWVRNFFISSREYKNRDKYIVQNSAPAGKNDICGD